MTNLKEIANSYFHQIYSSQSPRGFQDITTGLQSRVTNEMNASLVLPFSFVEVKKAVFSINTSKAPREDGLTALFYYKCWSIMGNDVFSTVRDFLEGDRMLKNANHNIISLTLKVKSVKSMKDLRPIGLCNVF